MSCAAPERLVGPKPGAGSPSQFGALSAQPRLADIALTSTVLGVALVGWAINQHVDSHLLKLNFAVAGGALAASAALAEAWRRRPQKLLRGLALATFAAATAGSIALA